MPELKIFDKKMQQEIESFYEKCFTDLGWDYDPAGRHSDIPKIYEIYMKNGCMWCLYDNDLLIGTIAVRNISKSDDTDKIAELKRMYILKEYQGKGYGRLLLDTVIKYSKENNYDKIYLDSRMENYAAVHLYRKYGFVEIPAYNDNTFAELYMELRLTK